MIRKFVLGLLGYEESPFGTTNLERIVLVRKVNAKVRARHAAQFEAWQRSHDEWNANFDATMTSILDRSNSPERRRS